MKAKVVRIGNSKGIRLPKAILEQYQISDEVEFVLEEASLRIVPVEQPRAGWSEAFEKMGKAGDDDLLIPDVLDNDNVEPWS